MDNNNRSLARKIPHGLGQHYADIHEILHELRLCNNIMDELIKRAKVDQFQFEIIEWSLWSSALTLFFKQFSNNEGRKLKINYKEVFKDIMSGTDYEAYNIFKGIRDGYIAHANNSQNNFIPLAMIDESRKEIIGVGVLSATHNGEEAVVDLQTFKDMINVAGLWCESKKQQIEKKLLEHVHKEGYEVVACWDGGRITQPSKKDLVTKKRETQ